MIFLFALFLVGCFIALGVWITVNWKRLTIKDPVEGEVWDKVLEYKSLLTFP